MRLLAGDVGGTKTWLALYEGEPDTGFRELRNERLPSADYPGLEAAVRAFLGADEVERAAFGVAGPVVDNTCTATNLPWRIDGDAMAKRMGLATVRLINDFQAAALGIGELELSDVEVLQDAETDPSGPIAVIGAGTGLGEAIIVPDDDGPRVLASEGGHVDFAPRNDVEIALLQFLLRRHDRVSVERVVSGRGLHAIYDFVVSEGLAETSDIIRQRVADEDPGAVIGTAALERSDDACVRAVELFVSAYGAEAGNLALKVLPTGGLYVAGGIAPRLLEKLKEPLFLSAFRRKGRMSALLDNMRVAVVTNPKVGLLGARRYVLGFQGRAPQLSDAG